MEISSQEGKCGKSRHRSKRLAANRSVSNFNRFHCLGWDTMEHQQESDGGQHDTNFDTVMADKREGGDNEAMLGMQAGGSSSRAASPV